MVKSFITPKDIQELKEYHPELNKDIILFLDEIRTYLNQVWGLEYQIVNKLQNIEELNEKYLEKYPSTAGYHILDSAFTGPDCPTELLSNSSKRLLGYFYGIYIRR